MNHHDYAQEVGMTSEQPRVPLAAALVVILVLAAAAWFAVAKFGSVSHDESRKAAHVAAPAAPQS